MTRDAIRTEAAPRAIGPYSQAIRADGAGYLFLAGQVAIDPATGELTGGTTAEQTRRVLANLSAVLAAAGSSLAAVVKTTVFLTDFSDFAEMNGVYAEHFGDPPPARSTVEVTRLPKGARVEIDAIALLPGRTESGR
jgi:2-iminobutanoate/2-iminopropanoate deaminase